MFCTVCGNTIYQDETFCGKCGKAIKPRGSSPPPPREHGRYEYPPAGLPPAGLPPARYPEHDLPPPRPTAPRPAPHPTHPVPHHTHPAPHPTRPAPHPPQTRYHEYNPSPPPNSGLKKASIIAICVALFALGVSVGGLFVMQRSQGDAEQPSPPPLEEEATATPAPEQTPDPEPTHEPAEGEEYPNEQEAPPYEDITPPNNSRSARFPFPGTMTRYGDSEIADVVFLQNTLNNIRRHYRSIRVIETAGGTFGASTFGAVVDFQLRVGLPPTGVVNADTWYALVEVFENPPSEPDPPFAPETQEWYLTLVNLHLRTEPSTAGESMEVMPQWSRVWVAYYIANDSWFFVQTEEGYTGYMKAEFLIMDGILP